MSTTSDPTRPTTGLNRQHGIALLTWVVSVLLLGLFMKPQWVLLGLGSIWLHEMGHWLMFRKLGSPAVIYMAGPIGAVTVPSDLEAIKHITDHQEYWLSMAGPAVNFGLALLGFAWQITHPGAQDGLVFAVYNLSLMTYNLIPFGLFDGASSLRAVFKSLPEDDDRVLSGIGWIMLLFVLIGMTILGYSAFFLPVVIVLIIWAAGKDDPNAWQHTTAMSQQRAYGLGVAQFVAIGLGMFLLAINEVDWVTYMFK